MANRWYEAGYSSGSAGKTLKLHIYTVDTNQNENWTVERADLYLSVTNTAGGWWNNYGSPAYVGINGNNTTRNVAWDARSTGDKLLIGTWDTRVYHNDDGSKSIGISASHDTNLGMGSASLSGTYDCDTIPRYASFTQHYVKARTLNTITIYWSANKSISAWQHSINGGAWQDCEGGNTYIIRNLQPNTTYNIRTRIQNSESGLWTTSGTLTTKTLDLPRVSSADEITIGQNLAITYTNPASTGVEIGLFTNDGQTAIRDYVSVSDGNYTFEFTEQEINNIYAQTPNSLFTNLRVYAKTSQNSQTYTTYKEIKFNVDIAENQPEFSNFIFTEQNYSVAYLTGGSPALLKGQSIAKVEISTQNKAIAKNGATMLRYEVINGNVTNTIEYSSTQDVNTIIPNVLNDTFIVRAIDSRGISTSVTVKGEMYDYQMPYISQLSFTRENGIGTKVFFNLEANFDNTNYPYHLNETNIQFRYREKDTGNYSEWISLNGFNGITVDFQNGKIVNKTDGSNWIPDIGARTPYEDIDASLQYQQLARETYQDFDGTDFDDSKYMEFEIGVEYDIEFKIVDVLSQWTRSSVLSSGIPATSKVRNDNGYYSLGINCFPDSNYALKVIGNSNLGGTDMDKFFIRNDGARINENREDGNSQIFSNCFAFEPTEESYGILFVSLGALNPSTTTKFKIKGFLTANDIDTEFEISFYASSSNIRNAKCKIENQEWLKSIYVCNSDDGLVLAFVNEYDGTSSYSTWNDTALFIESMYTSFNEVDLSQLDKNNWQCVFLNGFYITTNDVKCENTTKLYYKQVTNSETSTMTINLPTSLKLNTEYRITILGYLANGNEFTNIYLNTNANNVNGQSGFLGKRGNSVEYPFSSSATGIRLARSCSGYYFMGDTKLFLTTISGGNHYLFGNTFQGCATQNTDSTNVSNIVSRMRLDSNDINTLILTTSSGQLSNDFTFIIEEM